MYGHLVNKFKCFFFNNQKGVVIWEIFEFGKRPYTELDNTSVIRQVVGGLRLNKPDNCPEDLWDFVTKC